MDLPLYELKVLLDELKVSLDELKLLAENRVIKGYKNISKERLLSTLNKPKLIRNNFDNEKLKKIRKDLSKSRHKFSKSEVKEIRQKNLSTQKIKEIEKSLSRFKKYYDYDDAEYIGIRDIGNLFNQSTDKDYYQPVKTKSAFNGNYTEYESRGDKEKNLSSEEYLDIRPYLSNIINDHKTPKN